MFVCVGAIYIPTNQETWCGRLPHDKMWWICRLVLRLLFWVYFVMLSGTWYFGQHSAFRAVFVNVRCIEFVILVWLCHSGLNPHIRLNLSLWVNVCNLGMNYPWICSLKTSFFGDFVSLGWISIVARSCCSGLNFLLLQSRIGFGRNFSYDMTQASWNSDFCWF